MICISNPNKKLVKADVVYTTSFKYIYSKRSEWARGWCIIQLRLVYDCIWQAGIWKRPLSTTHPSLDRCCLKKSLAASLMAFSGVTRVRFTAAPNGQRNRETQSHKQRTCSNLCAHTRTHEHTHTHAHTHTHIHTHTHNFVLPLYMPKYPSDLMVLIRQSDLCSERKRLLCIDLRESTRGMQILQANCTF